MGLPLAADRDFQTTLRALYNWFSPSYRIPLHLKYQQHNKVDKKNNISLTHYYPYLWRPPTGQFHKFPYSESIKACWKKPTFLIDSINSVPLNHLRTLNQHYQTPNPQIGMATRRSPRSIERFCNELRLQNLTSEQTALLLSLSQLSGWSADRIALKIFELSRVRFTAEEVWDFHGNWILARKGRDDLNWEEQDIAEYLLTDAGIILTSSNPSVRLEYLGRPLHKTFEPVSLQSERLERVTNSLSLDNRGICR